MRVRVGCINKNEKGVFSIPFSFLLLFVVWFGVLYSSSFILYELLFLHIQCHNIAGGQLGPTTTAATSGAARRCAACLAH